MTIDEYTVDLKTALARRRQQAQEALKVRFCVDRDLVDQHADLTAERLGILARFDAERAALSRDERLGTVPAQVHAELDRRQAEATADVEARLAALESQGRSATFDLVFRVLDPASYQEVVNAHMKGDRLDATAFGAALCATCFRRAEQDGTPVDGITWDDLSSAMSFGELDAVQMQVVVANRGTVAAPF